MSGLISAGQLRRLNPVLAEERAGTFATVLDDALAGAEIAKSVRIRHFLAQIMQETGGLRGLVESTSYKDPVRLDKIFSNVQGVDHARRLIREGPIAIGNTIYANKNGNGGIATGDGFRFRGRGFLQITGRANYRTLGTLVGMPLEEQPDLLGQPAPAAIAAATFWKIRKINGPSDANDIDTVTLLVNGKARLHLPERKVWLGKTVPIWA